MMLANQWMEWFAKMDDGAQLMSVIIAGGTICVIAWLLINAWRRVRQSEHRTQIIGQLLARGFSADDITRVLASSDLAEERENAADARPTSDPEVRIVKALTDQSYSGDDINRVLAAARVNGRIDPAVVEIVKSLADSWSDASNIVAVLEERRRAVPDQHHPDQHVAQQRR
jgi:hypothetical protein